MISSLFITSSAARRCASSIVSMLSANISISCSSGRNISSVNSESAEENTLDPNILTNFLVILYPSLSACTILPLCSKFSQRSRYLCSIKNSGVCSSCVIAHQISGNKYVISWSTFTFGPT